MACYAAGRPLRSRSCSSRQPAPPVADEGHAPAVDAALPHEVAAQRPDRPDSPAIQTYGCRRGQSARAHGVHGGSGAPVASRTSQVMSRVGLGAEVLRCPRRAGPPARPGPGCRRAATPGSPRGGGQRGLVAPRSARRSVSSGGRKRTPVLSATAGPSSSDRGRRRRRPRPSGQAGRRCVAVQREVDVDLGRAVRGVALGAHVYERITARTSSGQCPPGRRTSRRPAPPGRPRLGLARVRQEQRQALVPAAAGEAVSSAARRR